MKPDWFEKTGCRLQDHPARDVVDTFYLSRPKKGKLPNKETVKAVAQSVLREVVGRSTFQGVIYNESIGKRFFDYQVDS